MKIPRLSDSPELPPHHDTTRARRWKDALSEGHLSTVRAMIAEGTPVNTEGDGRRSALGTALKYGHESLAHYLLDMGHAADDNGHFGVSPLMVAVNRSLMSVSERILDLAGPEHPDEMFLYACYWGLPEMAAMLLRRGARADTRMSLYYSVAELEKKSYDFSAMEYVFLGFKVWGANPGDVERRAELVGLLREQMQPAPTGR